MINSSRKNKPALSLYGLLLATILYIATNISFNSIVGMRLDVTEDGLFTLSEGSRKILNNIDEPIILHFFFSERLGREIPVYAHYKRRVRELLLEMVSAAQGKLILQEYQPKPFSNTEDLAVSFGIQGIPLDQSGELVYFGLAVHNTVDDLELIEFFQPEKESLLEYDLIQLIQTLSNSEPTVVGLMSSLPIMGDMQTQLQGGVVIPWALAKPLRDNFTVINLPETIERLPNNIDVMMLVHPQQMTKRGLYELEQFLFRGGRAIIFLDPKAESDVSLGPANRSSSVTGLKPLLKQWGIQVPTQQLVGDRSMALRINAGSAAQPIPADYILWLGIESSAMNQQHPISSQLNHLNLASSGYIVQQEGSPLHLEPLITSSKNSAPIDTSHAQGARPNILGLLNSFSADDKSYIMAAQLSGQATTAFTTGIPPRIINKNIEEQTQAPLTTGPINVTLVADSDMLDDRFWVQEQDFYGRSVETQIANNADFVINALGYLAGNDQLLTLRSRGVSLRPFDKVIALEQQAQQRLQETEQNLQKKLTEAKHKIAQLEGVRNFQDPITGTINTSISLSESQRIEMESLRQEMLAIRKQLRQVQRDLRKDVETLEAWLQFINIGMIPLLIFGLAIIIGFLQLSRRRRGIT